MSKKNVIYAISCAKFQENVFVSDKFASLLDKVCISVGLNVSECTVVLFSLLSFDKDGNEAKIYEKSFSASEAGELKIEYTFDPISLAVYRDAVDFSVKLEVHSGECEINVISVEESESETSNEDEDSLDNTAFDEEGNPKVIVRGLDGTEILVPRVPKKVLFIGNSLVFGIGGKYGMCSSSPDKDYYHYVTSHIKKYNPVCKFDKLYGSHFEHSESVEMFNSWYYEDIKLCPNSKIPAEVKFTEDLDLIIIQLSDNINTDEKSETFLVTGDMLVERIKKASPRARIIWVHGWYKKQVADPHIKELCKKWGIERVCISSCRSKETEAHNQKYYFDVNEGVQKPVKETWITHPGDLGMKKIADKIIRKLGLV